MVDENFIRNQLGKAADPQIHRMGIFYETGGE